MREEYDFSDAKRENPYIDRIQQHGYAIVVNCGAAQVNASDADNAPTADAVAEFKTEYHQTSN